MNAMQESLRGFGIAVIAVWVILCIAAAVYSQQKDIPVWVSAAVVPAFLVEAAFYMAAGMCPTRRRLESLGPPIIAALMTASAAVPYLIYSIGTGIYTTASLLGVIGLAAAASYWYVLLGKRPAADLGFLVLMAGVILAKVFPHLYAAPIEDLEIYILGVAMWVRTGVLAVLSLRRMEGIGFSFMPRREDWRIGFRNYLYFLPLGIGVALALGFLDGERSPLTGKTLFVAAATFAGMLWVVALSEEFFFRGLLQQFFERQMHSRTLAIVAASAIFGLAHLGFRAFPNWKFALLATIAGLFYGRAFAQAQSIRASMVTHALVNTTWRVFL
ncbi:MAG: CPBP family glutamic-type intramembrane protease [Bryobacteraceae bacterium]